MATGAWRACVPTARPAAHGTGLSPARPSGQRAAPLEPGPGRRGVVVSSPTEAVAATLDKSTMRSLVVEANDGIIATAGVVEGFVASGSTGTTLVLAGLCSMVAGGVALGGGRYSEEAAERDAREALIAEEREQLRSAPEQEFVELMGIYEAKGLSPELARQVAAELTAVDALTAHVEAEHRLPVGAMREAPVIVGGAAGLAYALGALVPLLAVMLTPDSIRPEATAIAAVVGLIATSVFMSLFGVARISLTLRRTLTVALMATGLSLLAGWVMQP